MVGPVWAGNVVGGDFAGNPLRTAFAIGRADRGTGRCSGPMVRPVASRASTGPTIRPDAGKPSSGPIIGPHSPNTHTIRTLGRRGLARPRVRACRRRRSPCIGCVYDDAHRARGSRRLGAIGFCDRATGPRQRAIGAGQRATRPRYRAIGLCHRVIVTCRRRIGACGRSGGGRRRDAPQCGLRLASASAALH